MITKPAFYNEMKWRVSRYVIDVNFWEISLCTGNLVLYLPVLFETKQEALNYINNAMFKIDD